MEIRALDQQPPFTTKDGSTIRSILDSANAPVKNQSLAEATIPAGGAQTVDLQLFARKQESPVAFGKKFAAALQHARDHA